MTVLLLAEQKDGVLNDVTARALTAAKQIADASAGDAVHVLVIGAGAAEAAKSAAKLDGVGVVHVAEGGALDHGLAEPAAALLVKLADHHRTIVAPATAATKNIMPRLAALLDVMQVSEITKVVSPDTFERPIYAGNAVQTVQTSDPVKVVTVRTAAFAAAPTGSAEAPVEVLDASGVASALSRFGGEQLAKSDRPELTSAKVIVSGGRAMGKAENFKTYIEPIADKLGAAMGASRAAVDAGLAPNDWQVGQTGKVVAPDLYIAVGISGAIQHLAGMKDSKVIVAINKDEDAPIFQVADYGLVGDLFTILPELDAALGKS